jgi:hypothetical protein
MQLPSHGLLHDGLQGVKCGPGFWTSPKVLMERLNLFEYYLTLRFAVKHNAARVRLVSPNANSSDEDKMYQSSIWSSAIAALTESAV